MITTLRFCVWHSSELYVRKRRKTKLNELSYPVVDRNWPIERKVNDWYGEKQPIITRSLIRWKLNNYWGPVHTMPAALMSVRHKSYHFKYLYVLLCIRFPCNLTLSLFLVCSSCLKTRPQGALYQKGHNSMHYIATYDNKWGPSGFREFMLNVLAYERPREALFLEWTH